MESSLITQVMVILLQEQDNLPPLPRVMKKRDVSIHWN